MYVTVAVTEWVTVTRPVVGSAIRGVTRNTLFVALVTDGALAAAAAPVGVVDASEIVMLSGDAFPLRISRIAPRLPRMATAIVSDAATAAPGDAVPARVGVVATNAAMAVLPY